MKPSRQHHHLLPRRPYLLVPYSPPDPLLPLGSIWAATLKIPLPILEKLSPEGGDLDLSIPKCENDCYLKAYVFAGVQEGNQCWRSNYVGGEWAINQTDCNIHYTGSEEFCGGKERINVFKAEQNQVTTTTTTSPGTSTMTTDTISETLSSGAMRNLAMF